MTSFFLPSQLESSCARAAFELNTQIFGGGCWTTQLLHDWQEQETPLYYDTKGGSRDRGLRAEVGAKAGAKWAQKLINNLEPRPYYLEPY